METPTPSLREQGVHALREGRLDGAIDLLARAVMADDNDAEAKAYLGVAYSQKGLHEQAVRALRSAVELQPQNISHGFNLAVAQERAGDAGGAAAEYQRILQLNPEHAQAKARLQALGSQAPAAPRPSAPAAAPTMASSPSMAASSPGAGAPPPGASWMAGAQTLTGPAQAGPPGTVQCHKCKQWSKPGLSCEWCSSPLQSRPTPSVGSAPWLQGPTAPGPQSLGPPIDVAPDMSSGEAFGRRFAASFVDGLIILVPVFVLSALLFPMTAGGGQSGDFSLSFYLLIFLFTLAYSAGMLTWRGQTLGKMALGIRVIGPDGGNPSFWRAAIRETIGKSLSQFLYLGYLWMLWDADQQCWHDKIVGTHVERA